MPALQQNFASAYAWWGFRTSFDLGSRAASLFPVPGDCFAPSFVWPWYFLASISWPLLSGRSCYSLFTDLSGSQSRWSTQPASAPDPKIAFLGCAGTCRVNHDFCYLYGFRWSVAQGPPSRSASYRVEPWYFVHWLRSIGRTSCSRIAAPWRRQKAPRFSSASV